jgi:hypothetical protein
MKQLITVALDRNQKPTEEQIRQIEEAKKKRSAKKGVSFNSQ